MNKNDLYLTNVYEHQFQQWFANAMQIIHPEKNIVDKSTINVTIVVTKDCNFNCHYCLTENTEIMDAYFNTKKINEIRVGDIVLGCDEFNQDKMKHRLIYPTKVTNVFPKRVDSVIKITFDNGRYIEVTKNHPLLTTRGSSKYTWREAGKFKIGQEVRVIPIIQYEEPNIEDINYKIGYIVACFLGDGSYKHYKRKSDGCSSYKMRFAVRDDELLQRADRYLKDLGFLFYKKPFKISTKYNMFKDALFANDKCNYFKLVKLIKDHFMKNKSKEYYCGFLAGIYDCEGHIRERTIRICNTNINIINEIAEGMKILQIPYVIENSGRTVNYFNKYNVRILSGRNQYNNLKFIKTVRPSISRKSEEHFWNKTMLTKSKIISIEELGERTVYNLETESHTYIANNIAVHNCYQHGKTSDHMTFETAKQTVDFLLSDRVNNYIDPEKSECIILDFIGGEPLLEIDLIDQFMDYFVYQAFKLNHRWANHYTISMSSNGALYETPKVQNFIKKYAGRAHIGITIDGNKELHDSCRVYRDGRGTYDDVVRNFQLALKQGNTPSTKVTIAPENLKYLCESTLHLFGLGLKWLHCNVVFEDVWNVEHAKELYRQLKMLADIVIEKELYKNHINTMFDESIGTPLEESDNQNYCGGDGSMLAIAPDGTCYPCLRYMDYCFSTKNREPLVIGHICSGIVNVEECPKLKELRALTRKSQSTDECFYCPIAKGCSWCSAFNYDIYGTANKRTTFHCTMQKARVLANCYYWNKLYRHLNLSKRFPYYMPDEWALEIIDQDEINMLKELAG